MTIVLILVALLFEGPYQQMLLKNHYYNVYQWSFDSRGLSEVQHPLDPQDFLGRSKELPDVKRYRTPFQVIDVVESLETGDPSMYINGRFQVASSSATRYHETFAHVSLGFSVAPAKKFLILGGGDGVLAAELLRRPDTEVVDVVEIDPVVLKLAREPGFLALNRGALDDPKVQVHVADAMTFIRGKSGVYDAAFIDLTYPFDFDSARFYSVEFLRVVYRSLAPNGILAAGSPFDLVDAPKEELGVLVDATLSAAEFKNFTAITNGNDNFVVAGKGDLRSAWGLPPGIDFSPRTPRLVRTTPVRAPRPGGDVLSIMRPRLLTVFDAFH